MSIKVTNEVQLRDKQQPSVANTRDADELSALCELLMCADPTPLSPERDVVIKNMANRMSQELGYSDWIEAYFMLQGKIEGGQSE